jgi:tetratricopeptide (TPR) repeat protein
MQSDYTPPDTPTIAPSRYAAAERASPRPDERAGPGQAALIGYALLVCAVLLAGAVMFVLPRMVPSVQMPPAEVASSAPTPPDAAEAPAPDADPLLTPAEQASARLDAQNALAAVLRVSEALRARAAHEWAAQAYAAAQTQIADGETAYREQRFPAALRAYAAATRQLQDIEKNIPDIVAGLVDEGERALLSTNSIAAQQAFERALALAPDDARARQGLARAQSLDRVIALIAEAKGHEKVGDTARARSAYREALTLDSAATEAAQALERIDRARTEKEYARAMSAGYRALEAKQFETAKQRFEEANRLRPESGEASNALKQTALRATAARIELALTAAANHERAERWNEAAGQYRAALALDRNLDVANSGLARASTRTAMDMELEKTLAQADQLGEETLYRQAQTLLDSARAVADAGPRLKRQIATLSTAVTRARTPVTVVLTSDGMTVVSVPRIGEFAPFAQQQLTLLAGRYTAVGKRDGYRDVRVEFAVDPASPPPPITVRCTEPVQF